MKNKIILTPHAGSGNHGCEAIVRATKKILHDCELHLFSSAADEDLRYGLDECCSLEAPTAPIGRMSRTYFAALLRRGAGRFDRLAFAPVAAAARTSRLMLSIGGDNYCYGLNRHLLLVNRMVRETGVPTVLWGCSVEPGALENDEILEDLSAFTLIAARETITRDALAAKGLTNVKLYPDPAFVLDRKDLELPSGFVDGNTVGINVSPLVLGLEGRRGAVMSGYARLIGRILSATDMNVALIPHVVRHGNDDRIPLKELYNRFRATRRVAMIGDCGAAELKGYIARCRFMVAARTHASIAAYSQGVPTLVAGYSVKARGIARDIFGTEENYVVPVQSPDVADRLLDAFWYLCDNETAIRKSYASMMGRYAQSAADAGNEIREICR